MQPRLSVQTESGLIAASLRSQLTGLIGWRGGNLQPGGLVRIGHPHRPVTGRVEKYLRHVGMGIQHVLEVPVDSQPADRIGIHAGVGLVRVEDTDPVVIDMVTADVEVFVIVRTEVDIVGHVARILAPHRILLGVDTADHQVGGILEASLFRIDRIPTVIYAFVSFEYLFGIIRIPACPGEEGKNVDDIYDHLVSEYSDKSYSRMSNKDVIIALSSANENNSESIKRYLQTFRGLQEIIKYYHLIFLISTV